MDIIIMHRLISGSFFISRSAFDLEVVVVLDMTAT